MPHILVVNDSSEFLTLMQDVLTDEGYQVTLGEYGGGVRELASRLRPDLIILDVRLPDMTGFEVLNVLRLDPATESIAVLLCTAAVRDVQAQEPLLRERGVPVLFKPFDLDDLLTTIRDILGQEM